MHGGGSIQVGLSYQTEFATTQEIRLYVNEARDGVTADVTTWRADGPLTIG
ncbi:MAG: hypothetical protein ACT4NY_14175 [Pseudonocardiales bacterium]